MVCKRKGATPKNPYNGHPIEDKKNRMGPLLGHSLLEPEKDQKKRSTKEILDEFDMGKLRE